MVSATDQEAVAHATRQTSRAEEGPEARPRPARFGAPEVGSPKQPDLAKRQRTYDHAIREFVAWYCSEPRLAFNRTVVLR